MVYHCINIIHTNTDIRSHFSGLLYNTLPRYHVCAKRIILLQLIFVFGQRVQNTLLSIGSVLDGFGSVLETSAIETNIHLLCSNKTYRPVVNNEFCHWDDANTTALPHSCFNVIDFGYTYYNLIQYVYINSWSTGQIQAFHSIGPRFNSREGFVFFILILNYLHCNA